MTASVKGFPRHFGWIPVVILLGLELFIVHASRHMFGFECHTARYAGFCSVARNGMLAGYSLAAVFILTGVFARQAWVDLVSQTRLRAIPLGMNLVGLGVLVATLPLLQQDLTGAMLALLALLWAVSVTLVLAGITLMIAPPDRWRAFFAQLGWTLPLVALAGMAAPFVAIQLRPLWSAEVLSGYTFNLVVWIMESWGQQIEIDPERKIIGWGQFFVDIAPSCSGIEGLVLTTTFAGIYLTLFRDQLRFPHALIILPIALVASWVLNSVRIAVLVQIGISGNPELAVGGFHSHAGWLMFTVLSLSIVLVTQWLGLFRKPEYLAAPKADLPPLLEDPAIARILPFAVFMGSALLASTFSSTPAVVYPLRALAMALALWLIWPHLRALPWRLDAVAVGSGVFIAVYWVALGPAPDPEAAPPLAEAGALVFALWVAVRVIGTTLLVPIIEELFFRGYLMDRIAPQGAALWRVALAVIVTTATFAALHDRWIAAAFAGLIFAAVTLRSRNLTDAIVSHGVANGLIALWVLVTGNWAVI